MQYSEQVLQIQSLLHLAGYHDVGKIDGLAGDKFTTATTQYGSNDQATGDMHAALLERLSTDPVFKTEILNAANDAFKNGDENGIRAAQGLMRTLGITVDGQSINVNGVASELDQSGLEQLNTRLSADSHAVHIAEPTSKLSANLQTQFQDVVEGQKNWAIRYGAEPFDFHILGKKTAADQWLENNGITAGIGSAANTNYIEIGTIDDNGDFNSLKRVHAMGLTDNWEMEAGEQRLVGFVVDGKYTPFTAEAKDGEKYKGDLIQRDDPSTEKSNQLQHAFGAISKNTWGDDYTKVVFQGSEREVLQLYGSMVRSTIELNNNSPEDMKFEMFGKNSNAFNSEMKEKLVEMSEKLGISERLGTHNASGLDIGRDYELETEEASPIKTLESIFDLRAYIDQLEKTAAEQLNALRSNGIDQDLDTKIPAPGQ